MNDQIKELLSGTGKCFGLQIEFPDGKPIRISGFPDGYPPVVLIALDQPDSEQIFTVLRKIGLVAMHPIHPQAVYFPTFINQPYENEVAGEIAYKTRRVLRRKFTPEKLAHLWALCAFAKLPCPVEILMFFWRHPRNILLLPLVQYGLLKTELIKLFNLPLKFLLLFAQ